MRVTKVCFIFHRKDGSSETVEMDRFTQDTYEGEWFGMSGVGYEVDTDITDGGVRTIILKQTEEVRH